VLLRFPESHHKEISFACMSHSEWNRTGKKEQAMAVYYYLLPVKRGVNPSYLVLYVRSASNKLYFVQKAILNFFAQNLFVLFASVSPAS
jgi:hypothetical protein